MTENFRVGDRVSRDSVLGATTLKRHGNVMYVEQDARVAGVVFDNHTDTEPIVCTFESLRLLIVPMEETSTHAEYLTVEHFHKLSEADKSTRIFNPGDSVAALVDTYDEPLKVVHGKVYGSAYSERTGIFYKIVTREGTKHVGLTPRKLVRI